MFINKDTVLSIIQLTEYQYRVYQEFLKICSDKTIAKEQTQIFMNAMLQNNKGEEKKH